ncbi:MAG: hypothetical protein HYX53_17125 [Chloroflexi bacterium]|nr:hypothetical protein [Chloroflexota bacterium]
MQTRTRSRRAGGHRPGGPAPVAVGAAPRGRHDAVIGLQRSVGNRAVGRLLAGQGPAVLVQRFGTTKKYDETQAEPAEGRAAPPMFSTHSVDPVITGRGEIRHEMKRPKHPELMVADDGTMAISKTKAESEEFYATDEVVDAANTALEAKHSAVILDNEIGNSISLKGKTLKMVKPGIRVLPDRDFVFGPEASFATNICIEVAQKVMGNVHGNYNTQAVFQGVDDEDTDAKTADFTPQAGAPEATHNLADYVATTDDPKKAQLGAKMNVRAEDSKAKAGPEYAKQSGKKTFKAKEKALGINKYAMPEVGEGFASYSTFSSKGGSGKGGHGWGYHYAGVVAKSMDQNDYMTLENYRRDGDINKLKAELYEKLMKNNKRLIEAKIAELNEEMAGPDAERLRLEYELGELKKARADAMTTEEGQALAKRINDLSQQTSAANIRVMDLKDKSPARALKEVVATIMEADRGSREEALAAAAKVADTEPSKRWFFHMYGSKKSQSFHEQAKESGFFHDPITLRVRPQAADQGTKG